MQKTEMISCVSKNKTSGEFVRCQFPADATICQSHVQSSQTAAQYGHQNGAYHVGPLVMCGQYPSIGTTHSGGGSGGNIAAVEQGKNYHVNIYEKSTR